MKKVISVFLSFVLLVTILPLSALSAWADEVKESVHIAAGDDAGINAEFVTSVKVKPNKQMIKRGSSFTFTAEVVGSIQTVTWSISSSFTGSGTAIDPATGKLTVSADEAYDYLYVRATSTFDESKYSEAYVEIIDEDVYITSLTVTPSSANVPKGGYQQFQAEVVGTDFNEVAWTISGNNNENTKISDGSLYVSSEETATTIIVKATSLRDPNKFDTATVTVVDQTVIDTVNVVYDASGVGVAEGLTGRMVSEALSNAVEYNSGVGTNVDNSTVYTCLIKDLVIDADNKATYTKLYESDEPLSPSEDYWFMFNVENESGYIWGDELPSVTVNGKPADGVSWRSAGPSGDINVYIKVEFSSSIEYIDTIELTGPKPYVGEYVDDYWDTSLFEEGDPEKYYISAINWAIKTGEDTFEAFDTGAFESGKEYFVWIYIETQDDYQFSYTSSGDPGIKKYTYNGWDIEPIGALLDSNHVGLDFTFKVRIADPSADVTVTPYPESKLGSAYAVSGREVTVSFDTPCKLGYLSGGKYVQIPQQSVVGTSHKYIVPDDVDEVILVINGDTNLDGRLSNADSTKLKAAVKGMSSLSNEAEFASDVNGDKKLSNADSTKLKAVIKGMTALSW